MFTSKPRSIDGLFLLAAVIGLVFGSAGPASAVHYSVNGYAFDTPGEEWGPNMDKLCSDSNNQFMGARFPSTYYLLTDNAFTFLLYDGPSLVAHYAGPLSMRIDHGQAVFGPQGAAPGDCPAAVLLPIPVPLTGAKGAGAATIAGNAGYVNCQQWAASGSPGTYTRVADDVTFDIDLSCTVKGNNTGYTQSRYVWTTFTILGTQNTSGYLKFSQLRPAVSAPQHQ